MQCHVFFLQKYGIMCVFASFLSDRMLRKKERTRTSLCEAARLNYRSLIHLLDDVCWWRADVTYRAMIANCVLVCSGAQYAPRKLLSFILASLIADVFLFHCMTVCWCISLQF